MTIDYMQTIEDHESIVRSYVRSFPTVFEKAKGSYLYDGDGKAYLDFFAGASVMNYGHNHPELQKALIEYLQNDGVVHTLDMATKARAEFLDTYHRLILEPRGMEYRVQFPGPTGTNAVETALKIARKVTGREDVISFTNAFHGMTLGSLAVTGNEFKRKGAGIPLTHGQTMPYCGYFGPCENCGGPERNCVDYLDRMLKDGGSGVDHPAAIILEPIQGEGGLNSACLEWMRQVEALCRKYDMLLIVDDIQAGNGRTGPYFSFEEAGIKPDVIPVSKSISGFGMPLAITLVKPEHDIWEPGEHNGTFRGFNPAMITAKKALELYWSDDKFEKDTLRKGELVRDGLQKILDKHPETPGSLRGRGMFRGIAFEHHELAEKISEHAFERQLIIETSGPRDEVLKLLPPLVTSDEDLKKGLDIIEESLVAAAKELGIR